MINLKQDDAVADAVREILQQEALKGDQHKIDANKNNKIDAHDFKLLRGKKKDVDEEVESVDEAMRSGFTHRDAGEAQRRREQTLANNPRIAAEVERRRKAAEAAKKQPVQERQLSPGETAEKERIVKGMKPALSGFKSRYGEKAKSVMYGTATKLAKNEDVEVASTKTLGQFKEGWEDMLKSVRDKAATQPSGGSGVKKGTRYGGANQKSTPAEPEEKKK